MKSDRGADFQTVRVRDAEICLLRATSYPMFEAAKIVAFTAEAVARIAAVEMITNPAVPRTARPASARTCPASASISFKGTQSHHEAAHHQVDHRHDGQGAEHRPWQLFVRLQHLAGCIGDHTEALIRDVKQRRPGQDTETAVLPRRDVAEVGFGDAKCDEADEDCGLDADDDRLGAAHQLRPDDVHDHEEKNYAGADRLRNPCREVTSHDD